MEAPGSAKGARVRPVGSKYLLVEPLGRGGTGTVWRAQVRTGEGDTVGAYVAIKVLREELATDPEVVMRFLRERSVLLRLTHPNIVRVRDLVVEGELLALVMDLVDGPDLYRYLHQNGPLGPVAGALLMAQVVDALAASHADGVVHRDLKPANVLLETISDGAGGEVMRPMLTDFGIARLADSPGITRTEEFVGTPAYVAPESAEGRPQTSAVDVYGAGIMLYELVTGRPPFQGDGPLQILQAHLSQQPQRPRNLPEPVWTVIERCLRKNPAERPGSIALARALRVVADGVGVHATPAQIDAADRVAGLLIPDAEPTVVVPGAMASTGVASAGPATARGMRYDPAAATMFAAAAMGAAEDRTQVLPPTAPPNLVGAADRTQVLPPTPNGASPVGQPPSGPHPWEQQLQAARTRNEPTQVRSTLSPEFDPRSQAAPQVAPPPYRAPAPGQAPNGQYQQPPQPQSNGRGGAAQAAGRPQTAPPPYSPPKPAPAPYQEPQQQPQRGSESRPEPERPRREPRERRPRRRMRIPGGGCLRNLVMLAVIAAVIWYFTPLQHWIHNVETWWNDIIGTANQVKHTVGNIPHSLPTSLPGLGGGG